MRFLRTRLEAAEFGTGPGLDDPFVTGVDEVRLVKLFGVKSLLM